MYGKLLVLLMLAFCLTEVMDNKIKPLAFQVGSNYIKYRNIFFTKFIGVTLECAVRHDDCAMVNLRFQLTYFTCDDT